jgi:hypothetical protein
LVCADKDFGTAIWGCDGDLPIGANGNGIADGTGLQNTLKILEYASTYIDKGFWYSREKPLITAARLCIESNYNGYNDWYLPTLSELRLVIHNLFEKDLINFIVRDNNYWSSTECYTSAYDLKFDRRTFYRTENHYSKRGWVRNFLAVRAF